MMIYIVYIIYKQMTRFNCIIIKTNKNYTCSTINLYNMLVQSSLHYLMSLSLFLIKKLDYWIFNYILIMKKNLKVITRQRIEMYIVVYSVFIILYSLTFFRRQDNGILIIQLELNFYEPHHLNMIVQFQLSVTSVLYLILIIYISLYIYMQGLSKYKLHKQVTINIKQ